MTEEEEKTIWKLDKIPINNQASKTNYNKIICYWIRTHYNANTKLSDDVINFVAAYLSISISYSTNLSNKYKSDCIKIINDGNAFLLKDSIDKSSFAVIRCEKELQHGMVTEYKLKLRSPHTNDFDNIFIIGIVNNKFNDFTLHTNMGEKINNFWGFMDHSYSKQSHIDWYYKTPVYKHVFNIYNGKLSEQVKSLLGYEGMGFNSQISSKTFMEITVRVNLNDYVLSFWISEQWSKKDKPICFIERVVRDDYGGGTSIVAQRGAMRQVYCPIVVDLPNDKSFKWYPAIFINQKQDTPISIQFVE